MRIHCIRHEPFEGLGAIETWINSGGHSLNCTHIYLNQELPVQTDFDLLIVMGGTASVYESAEKPWIDDEKKFIHRAMDSGCKILGICFGAQLLASVLGARVYPGRVKEIGWFPIRFNEAAKKHLGFLPESELVFHWHGDTFDLPDGALGLASSDLTANQGFVYNNSLYALQFHLEMTKNSLENMVKAGGSEIKENLSGIQSEEFILGHTASLESNNQLMNKLLDFIKRN